MQRHRWLGWAVLAGMLGAATCGDDAGGPYEGDEAGECNDGVDNDRDLLFDCDDPGCAGSPLCAGTDADADGDASADADADADDDGGAETASDVTDDTAGDVTTDGEPEDGPPADVEATDESGEDAGPRGTVGAACAGDGDCAEGLTCLLDVASSYPGAYMHFPGGYCARDCEATSCWSREEVCVMVYFGAGYLIGSYCMLRCDFTSECRSTEGYVCRALPPSTTEFCLME